MTKTKQTWTEPEARQYFSRMLQMNPLSDPAGVLALRRTALGLPAAVREEQGGSLMASAEQRAAALAELDRLRREFWTLPLEQLQRALEAINVKRLPDLRPLVTRLRTVAACRGEFPRLAASAGNCLPLFHAFKTAVVLPPGEAGPHKDQFIRTVRDRQQIKAVRQLVERIRSDYPVLFQLEKDWFETLLKLKPRQVKTESMTFSTGESEWGSFGPVAVFAAIILLRILLSALR
jgi:hypothetical protein